MSFRAPYLVYFRPLRSYYFLGLGFDLIIFYGINVSLSALT